MKDELFGLRLVSGERRSPAYRSGYLLMFRMARAAELLWKTDLPVAAVAERVGFSQPAYFFRSFRQYFHCTPLQYKRQITETHAAVIDLFYHVGG
ncbi:MAG TPA: helix-turn-helix domain-containing protein [Armatimonadota bacterium]|jgi:AraC-like DNA-binding protein